MSKVISISDKLYDRLKPKTNDLGGRSPKKVSFDFVIEMALDDQDRYKKRRINNSKPISDVKL